MSEAQRQIELEERYAHLQRHMTEQDKAMLELSEEVARGASADEDEDEEVVA